MYKTNILYENLKLKKTLEIEMSPWQLTEIKVSFI